MKITRNKVKHLLYTGIAVLFFSALPVAAVNDTNGEEAMDRYRERFRSYREARMEFELARERYLKLSTLATRDDAFSATQKFLKKGIEVLNGYLEVLGSRIGVHDTAPPELASMAVTFKSEDNAEYASLRKEVDKCETLAQLSVVSEKIADSYEDNEAHALFLNTVLMIADLRSVQRSISATAAEVKVTVQEDSNYPDRDKILSEWYIKITNKLEQATDVLERASQDLQGIEEEKSVGRRKYLVTDTQKTIDEAVALNMEVVQHLLEIVRAKKY